MSDNILKQPYADEQYAEFAIYANENNKRIEDYNGDKYALSSYEILKNGEIVDFSNTDDYKANIATQEAKIQAMKNITKRQLLIWLYTNKQKTEDDILSAIGIIADNDQKYLAKVNYSGTNNFYYGNSFVPIIGGALGLTADDLKTMFDEAVNL
jgi:hypothetical protein